MQSRALCSPTTFHPCRPPDPKVQDFTARYREAYGSDPSSFAALGYDGAMMLFQAIENAGSTDSPPSMRPLPTCSMRV